MKKLLTLTLSLLMAFSLCLTINAEDDYVAKIGDTGYASLQDAINNANTGDKIIVIKEITDIETLTVNSEKNITIDLNGNVISTAKNPSDSSKHYYILENYGTLILEDSVGTGRMSSRGIDNYGTLTINSGTYEAIDAGGGAGVWNNKNAVLNVNGGELNVTNGLQSSGYNDAICVYDEGGIVTITGGKFDSNSKSTYAIISIGNLTISPAEGKSVNISGQKGGIGINGGNVVINGGTSISGDYYGLYVSNSKSQATVTVNDCIFDGNAYSVYLNRENSLYSDSTVVINGGTYNKPITTGNAVNKDAMTVKGGTFPSDVSEYLASDYNVVKLNDVYKVVKNDTKVEVPDTTTAVAAVSEDARSTINNAASSIKDNNGDSVTITASTQIVLASESKTLNETETDQVEAVKETIVEELKVDTSKQELKYIPLDITLTAINGDASTRITDLGEDSTGEAVEIPVTLYLNDNTVALLNGKEIKVIRIHKNTEGNDEIAILPATLTNNALTFNSGKFSTYVIAYSSSVSTNTETKSYSSKDKNQDGVISCEEEMDSANWIWSESKKACVYKVSNTSVR